MCGESRVGVMGVVMGVEAINDNNGNNYYIITITVIIIITI